MNDLELRGALVRFPPGAGDDLRRLQIREQADRDALAEQLLQRTIGADDLAQLTDMMTIDEARRRVGPDSG